LSLAESMTPPSVSPGAPVIESNGAGDPGYEIDPEPPETTATGATIGPAWAHGVLERAPSETDLDLEFDEDAPLAAAIPGPDANPGAPADPGSDVEAHEDESLVEAVVAGDEPEPASVTELVTEPEPEPELEVAPAPIADAPIAAPEPEPEHEAEPLLEPEPVSVEPVLGHEDELDVEVPAAAQAPEPQWPETRAWPPPGATQSPAWPVPEAAQRPRAGAYLPPSALLTTVAEPGETDGTDHPDAAPETRHPSVAVADGPRTETAKADARRMPGIDPAFPPQIVVVGAGIAILGFVLPWAPIVIGSGRIGGYLEQWGLAGPGHPLLLLAIIALGAFASQVDRLPRWARPGIPALVLAGVLVGLLWPYLFGTIQASVGVYVTLAGALVLSVGGMLDLWLRRHAGAPRAV
jgi:hypothetical protein